MRVCAFRSCANTCVTEMQLYKDGWIKPEEKVVLLNTGSGLKYPETVRVNPPVLNPNDKIPADA